MLLSIIVPVFNVDLYLRNCLESIFSQIRLENTEVILVNDGSTDESLSICNEYLLKYSNVKLIDQKNQGLSIARNVGLQVAEGVFIWFIDSDDWINVDSFEAIYSYLSDLKLEVLALGSVISINGKFIEWRSLEDFKLNTEYMRSPSFEVGAPFYIFNRKVFNKFTFKERILHEDEDFTNKVVYWFKNIKFLDQYVYVANQRQGSITRSTNPQRAFDLLIIVDSLYLFLHDVEQKDKTIFYNRIALLFNNALYNTLEMNNSDKIRLLTEIKSRPFIFDCLKKAGLRKYRLEGYLMSLFPAQTITLYTTLKKFAN